MINYRDIRQQRVNRALRRPSSNLVTNRSLQLRAGLSSSLSQYDGNRDYLTSLGYSRDITINDYVYFYKRMGIAKRIIDAPAKDTWRGAFLVTDDLEKQEDSVFEKAFSTLFMQFKLGSVFQRLDRLSAIGEFGILVMGFDDGLELTEPCRKASSLLYLQPYSQEFVSIDAFDEDISSERYGMPVIYKIRQTNQKGQANTSKEILIHYTRVIHVAEDKTESDIYGIPKLKPVWNYLFDLLKVSGGSAEMYWRNADPKIVFETGADAAIDMDETEMSQKMDEIQNNLRRAFTANGMTVKLLSPNLVEPTAHAEVQFKLISATTAIPLRILTGSERGELASTQDREAWLSVLEERRYSFAEPDILRAFIDRCVQIGILPKPKDNTYEVHWSDIRALGKQELANLARVRAEAVSYYLRYPFARHILPLEAFLSTIMGLSEEEVQSIITIVEKEIDEGLAEQALTEDSGLNKTLGEKYEIKDPEKSYHNH